MWNNRGSIFITICTILAVISLITVSLVKTVNSTAGIATSKIKSSLKLKKIIETEIDMLQAEAYSHKFKCIDSSETRQASICFSDSLDSQAGILIKAGTILISCESNQTANYQSSNNSILSSEKTCQQSAYELEANSHFAGNLVADNLNLGAEVKIIYISGSLSLNQTLVLNSDLSIVALGDIRINAIASENPVELSLYSVSGSIQVDKASNSISSFGNASLGLAGVEATTAKLAASQTLAKRTILSIKNYEG